MTNWNPTGRTLPLVLDLKTTEIEKKKKKVEVYMLTNSDQPPASHTLYNIKVNTMGHVDQSD
jgi:hypothetical protein